MHRRHCHDRTGRRLSCKPCAPPNGDGDSYVINGGKTYITNGQLADAVIVAAKTDLEAGSKAFLSSSSTPTPSASRGKRLDKIGHHSADTSELFFNDARAADEFDRRGESRLLISDAAAGAGAIGDRHRRPGSRAAAPSMKP